MPSRRSLAFALAAVCGPGRGWASASTSLELLAFPRDFGAHPQSRIEWWYVTGALAAAVVRHFWSAPAPRPRIVGVEPTSAACVLESVAAGQIVTLTHPQESIMAGLNCATPSLIAWPLVSRGIDMYLAVPDSFVADATRLLAADGIVAGECGAAGLAAMTALTDDPHVGGAREALGLGEDSRVLLICTEGATDPAAYRRLTADRS